MRIQKGNETHINILHQPSLFVANVHSKIPLLQVYDYVENEVYFWYRGTSVTSGSVEALFHCTWNFGRLYAPLSVG